MCKDIIEKWANQNGIYISNHQYEELAAFQQKVLEVNKKMNLTRITNDEEFAVKHFIDSMTLLPYIPPGATVLDIGTGAGFPGIVLGILRPDIRLELLDSLKKRVVFLEESLEMLGLAETVKCIPERAEDWAKTGAQYDVCTARAVAKMDKLLKYSMPLVRPGGVFLAMKGADVADELDSAEAALWKFDARIKTVKVVRLTDDISHSIVVVEKM